MVTPNPFWQKSDPYRCSRCGFCLAVCPTYRLTPREPDSPRGRLVLLRREPLSPVAGAYLDRCLGCRACEAACPAGTSPARAVQARATLSSPSSTGCLMAGLLRFAARTIIPAPGRLGLALRLLHLLDRTFLQLLKLFPGQPSKTLALLAALLTPFPPRRAPRRTSLLPARTAEKWRVAFFTGCIMESALRTVNDAAIELRRQVGCTVVIPPAQTCCGALPYHLGDKNTAAKLARQNLDAFAAVEPYDFVVVTAAACAVHLREYPELFPEASPARTAARSFAARVRELAEFLRETAPPLLPVAPGKVACHESCLLRNTTRASVLPAVLSRLPGVEILPAPHLGCCGSAGIYLLRHPDVALALLDAEVVALAQTGAATVVTDNPGCLLFLRYGLERHNLTGKIAVQHLATFLHVDRQNRQ
ncbi:(Fe-S)-binding protein [Thermodesulfitimonas sp.]